MKRFLSVILSVVVFVCFPCNVFASYTGNEFASGIVADESEGSISVQEDESTISAVFYDSNTKKMERIVRNKLTNSVYSSYTNQEVNLGMFVSNEISLQSVTSYETHYVSYAELRSIIGDNASVTGVAALILTLFPGVNTVAGVVGMLATITGGAATMFIPNDSNHGLIISTKVEKYYRGTTKNRHVYKKVTTIQSIKKY